MTPLSKVINRLDRLLFLINEDVKAIKEHAEAPFNSEWAKLDSKNRKFHMYNLHVETLSVLLFILSEDSYSITPVIALKMKVVQQECVAQIKILELQVKEDDNT